MSSLHLATLSAEPSKYASFIVAAFDVVMTDQQRVDFINREPEYEIVSTPFYHINCNDNDGSNESTSDEPIGNGIICLASKDCDLRDDMDHLHAISTQLKIKVGFGTGHKILDYSRSTSLFTCGTKGWRGSI
jgi:hypothetical protein